jgi:hypothetical protein
MVQSGSYCHPQTSRLSLPLQCPLTGRSEGSADYDYPNVSPIDSRTSRMVSRASSWAFSQPSAMMLRT